MPARNCFRAASFTRRCLLVLLLTLAATTLVAQPQEKGPAKLTVRGVVVDAAGKPVAGATVSAVSSYAKSSTGGKFSGVSFLETTRERTTDAQGAFTLEVSQGDLPSILRVRARHKNAFTAKAVEHAGTALEKPITLTISPEHARGLAIRVVDEAGKPVASAALTAQHRPSAPANFNHDRPKPYGGPPGLPAWTTTAEGRFEALVLDPDGAYQVEVNADGFLPEKTPWRDVGESGSLKFGEVVLRRLRVLEGQVRDRQGKPVADARVVRSDGRGRVKATTNAEGKFQLSAGFFPPGFLFVEKDGFRFHGQRCDRAELTSVTLARRTEPPVQRLSVLPPALPLAERKALASRLLEPQLQKALQSGGDNERFSPLDTLARIDPARVLEELEKRPFQNAWRDSYLRRTAAQTLLRESFDEARSVVDSMKEPGFRSTGYLDLFDARPAEKKAAKLALLNQALLHARAVEANGSRMISFGEIARRLWELGEKERATKLLQEGQALATQLPTGGPRDAFALDLALTNLPAAKELLKDLKDPFQYARHHGLLAYRVADTHPTEAEKILELLLKPEQGRQDRNHVGSAVNACGRMATADLARARKLAATIQLPDLKAQALGKMAQALVRSKPEVARALLDEAFAGLAASGEHYISVPSGLLSVATEIDPDLLPEFFWRGLSMHDYGPRTGEAEVWGKSARFLGALAQVVARYDRVLPLALIEEYFKLNPQDPFSRIYQSGPDYAYAAVALVDPRRAVALVEKLPDGPYKSQMQNTVISTLLSDGKP